MMEFLTILSKVLLYIILKFYHYDFNEFYIHQWKIRFLHLIRLKTSMIANIMNLNQ